MSNSILNSVKTQLNIHPTMTVFDDIIVLHINTVLGILEQIGVNHAPGFSIEDENAVWSDYIGDSSGLGMIKTLVGLRVRQLFDPPTTSFQIKAFEDQIKELECRINLLVDGKPRSSTTVNYED